MVRLEIAAVYIGINILILVVLAFLVIAARFKHKIVLGDGGSDAMSRAIRAHANAAETIPAGLVGLLVLALLNEAAPGWLLHLSGATLTLGRLIHAIGLHHSARNLGRMLGMILTAFALILIGAGVIYAGLSQQL